MSIKGKIMIRKGNENHHPCIVYVSHKNRFCCWVSHELNTGNIHLSNSSKDFIPFNFKLFNQMDYQWEIDHCDIKKQKMIENLKEWQ